MELQRLPRKRATDEVYEAMRDAILNGAFSPGARLNMEELSHRLGVSMTPMRHAMQQLATEGLIEIKPRSGTFVATLTAGEVEETFEIRCALECLAGERAVQRIGGDDIAHYRNLLAALALPVDSKAAAERHEKANFEFHATLIRLSGSQRLAEIYEDLNAHLKIARIHGREAADGRPRNWPERLETEQREHEQIVAALEARDAPALTAALRRHIYRAKADLVANLPQD